MCLLCMNNKHCQAKIPMWHAYRAEQLTASRIHDILCMKDATDPTNTIKSAMGYSGHFTCKAMQWGLDMEAATLKLYEKQIHPFHTDLSVAKSGLVIHPEVPYIDATPYGIRCCKCHDKRIVEVKCPYSFRTQHRTDCFWQARVPHWCLWTVAIDS